MRHRWPLVASFFLMFFSHVAHAAPNLDAIPDLLKPWVPWVLKDSAAELCPFLSGSETTQCAWSSKLQLNLENKGGSFSQTWQVEQDSWVPLPGDRDHWPQEVLLNKQAAVVLEHEDRPQLYLKPGQYQINGKFLWDELAESFPLPPETSLLELTIGGKKIVAPKINNDGSVWLQAAEGEEPQAQEADSLEIKVYRKISDSVPMNLTTQLNLQVSGKNRELILNEVLPQGFIPLSLESTLPARWEKSGALKVQLRPGNWQIVLQARSENPQKQIGFEARPEPWPQEEVWVFEARNDLRLTMIEGVAPIDPKQIDLPAAWKMLPAYRLVPGNQLQFIEKRRGDADPAPDQLSLHRSWWLDFSGQGWTLHDEIQGTLRHTWRLEANQPLELGRVSINGEDQFITRVNPSPKAGVEIRQGQLQLSADSRLEGQHRKVAALGWDQDFKKVSGVLNLPPGWRVLSVLGVDKASETWISSWTLLDLFLVLVIALIFIKLWGFGWGLLALIAMMLAFPEYGFPRWIWLVVLAFEALRRLISSGKVHRWLSFGKWVSLLVMIIWLVPFLVSQIRVGLYPALEYPTGAFSTEYQGTVSSTLGLPQTENMRLKEEIQKDDGAPPPPPEAPAAAPINADSINGKLGSRDREVLAQPMLKSPVSQRYLRSEDIQLQGTDMKVQTGPGLPTWSWNRVNLQWSGPVEKNQSLRFLLISPWQNCLLAFLRVALLLSLLLCLLGKTWRQWRQAIPATSSGALILMATLTLFSSSHAQAQAFPSPEILEQLKTQLLEKPECYPNCAQISRMKLEAREDHLQLRLQVAVQSDAAIPLPSGTWLPEKISVDGQEANGLIRLEEVSWLRLAAGSHEVILEGAIPLQQSLSLNLPMRPYYFEAQLEAWTLEGLHENGAVDDSLRLTRSVALTDNQVEAVGESLGSGIPAFVEVTRRLVLGLKWEVVTTVTRRSPEETPVVLEIPLLEGESVLTEGIRVQDKKVLVNMAAGTSQIEWRSSLAEAPQISLQAPDSSTWIEVWQLEASPLWHVAFAGIPWVQMPDSAALWLPEWRPWPIEKVEIAISKPEGIPGQTLTLDNSQLQVTPGLRYSDYALGLTLRSSLGGQHLIQLPAESKLQSVTINNNPQPLRLDQGKLALPITPGSQQIQIHWQQPVGMKMFYQSPVVNVGLPNVNSQISISVPQDRWLLYAGGPMLGPTVLYWSLLLVILLFAWGLGRVSGMPLKTLSWFLLGIGISQFPMIPVQASLVVIGWFFLMRYRHNHPESRPFWFDLRQLLIPLYTLITLWVLGLAIYQGLLGQPEMQVAGNISSALLLNWFQDRSAATLPRPWILSVPLYVYRLMMLAWALWIAFALLRWLRWAWQCYSQGTLWKTLGIFKKPAAETKASENSL